VLELTRSLLFVFNTFRVGAVSNILLDVYPYLIKYFKIKILFLEPINENDLYVKLCRDQDISLQSLGIDRKRIWKSYRRLKKYLIENPPDIIHSNLGRSDIYCAFAKPYDSKLVSTLHCEWKNHNYLTRLGYRLTDHLFNYRILISQTVEQSYLNAGVLKTPHSVIYNPLDFGRIENAQRNSEIRRELGVLPDDFLLINVARYIPCKGQKFLIQAMHKIIKNNFSVKLLLVGRGPLEGELRSQIDRLHLGENVIITGFRTDIPVLLKSADAFLFSSLWEGLGIAVIEAMAAKLPIIAPSLPALREYIRHGKEGLLIDIRDSGQVAEKVLFIANNQKLRKSLGHRAYLTAREKFNAEQIANNYLMVYDSLMEYGGYE